MKTLTNTKSIKTWLTMLSLTLVTNGAWAVDNLSWNNALQSNDPVSGWIRAAVVAVMSIFVMISVILGALAFKQLANDGNWKEFWSKIAGSVGMFTVPIFIYWLAGK